MFIYYNLMANFITILIHGKFYYKTNLIEIYTPLGPTIKDLEQASRSCLGVLSPFSYGPHSENTVALGDTTYIRIRLHCTSFLSARVSDDHLVPPNTSHFVPIKNSHLVPSIRLACDLTCFKLSTNFSDT